MTDPHALPAARLRHRAEGVSAGLPPLLAAAEHLAATVILGEHGRRRAGVGDEFWQYRAAHPGDAWRDIDWRRSGRSDAAFVREKEWQAAQSVLFWIDTARAMAFSGSDDRPSKGDRAKLLGLAGAILLNRGGERVGLMQDPEPPRHGEAQLLRIAAELDEEDAADYGVPVERPMPTGARAVLISDFLGDWSRVETVLSHAADRGVKGVLLQVLDPQEEAFPFDGRTIFESMSGAVSFETLKAGELKPRYLERLAARKARLADVAARTGWQYSCHHTGDSAQSALLWLYRALEGGR